MKNYPKLGEMRFFIKLYVSIFIRADSSQRLRILLNETLYEKLPENLVFLFFDGTSLP